MTVEYSSPAKDTPMNPDEPARESSPHDSAAPPVLNAHIRIRAEGREMELNLQVAQAPARPTELLPLLRDLSEAFIGFAVEDEAARGRTVSCRKGCGACCRQLVPLSATEARMLANLVDAMPEPRRSTIQARFDETLARLDAAGQLERLRRPESVTPQELSDLGREYFRAGVPCPFLEDEACSIHPDRPLPCREYLVTNNPALCATPGPETIRTVPMTAKVSVPLAMLDVTERRDISPWIPLVLALEWADAHPNDPPEWDGPKLVETIFARLTGPTPSELKAVPPAERNEDASA